MALPRRIVQQHFFINVIFAFSLLIFLGIGYIAFQNASRWMSTIELITRTRETLLSCQKVLVLVHQAETTQRGYLLSGDSTYLPSYSLAISAAEGELKKIHSLRNDNPNIQKRLNTIEVLVQKRIELLKNNILIRNKQGITAVQEELKSGKGEQVMSALQNEVSKLSADENYMLRQYKANAGQMSTTVLGTIFAGTAISIGLLLWAFFLLRNQMQEKETAMQSLASLNETLEQKVLERTNELQASLEAIAANNSKLYEIHKRQQSLLEKLRKSENLFQEIYDGSADALFLYNKNNLLVESYNQQALELFEFADKREFVGKEAFSLLKKPFTDTQREIMLRQLKEKKQWHGEFEYLTRSGRSFWGDAAVSVINMEDKQYYLARIRDITDRKNAEKVIHLGQLELIKQQLITNRALATIEEDNLRKTQELEEARAVQLSMLPQHPPKLPNIEMAMLMKTSTEVGGDYYDYKIDDDQTLTVIIGDATGHGLKAGIVVATVKSYFQTLANQYGAVDLLKRLSEGIQNLQIRSMYMGITVIKIKDHQFTIASSGMPPLYLYKKQSQTIEAIVLKGLFLGSSLDTSYQVVSRSLQKGDTLLAMSDGLAELFNPEREMLTYDRIQSHFGKVAHHTPDQIIEELMALGDTWTAGKAIEDDITLVVIKSC